MQRRNFHVEDEVYLKLEELAQEAETPVAEQVRNAIAFWLAYRRKEQQPSELIRQWLELATREDRIRLQLEEIRAYYEQREGTVVSLETLIIDSIELRYKEIRDRQNNRARITDLVNVQGVLVERQGSVEATLAQVDEKVEKMVQLVERQGSVEATLTQVDEKVAQMVQLLAELLQRLGNKEA